MEVLGTPLDELVNMYLDQEEAPDSLHRRITTLGIRALRHIYKHATGANLTVELAVLPNKTAMFPCDCLNALEVSVMGNNGNLSPLTEDRSLSSGDLASAGRTEVERQVPDTNINSDLYFSNNGGIYPFLYTQMGVGARSDLGFYKFDLDSRLIIFDFRFSFETVWLEYVPMMSFDGKYYVNPFFEEAVISFIGWKDKRNSISDRNQEKINFDNEMRIGRRSLNPLKAGQIYNQYSRTTRLARF